MRLHKVNHKVNHDEGKNVFRYVIRRSGRCPQVVMATFWSRDIHVVACMCKNVNIYSDFVKMQSYD